MDTRFTGGSFSSEHEDDKSSSESHPESPTQFGMLSEIAKETSPMMSNRKSRKAAQKRVVSIPIKDSEGTRFKGDGVPPPSDSWAWRKYGQKPIKGSPYPRAYYKCSSSKGCPARKQVERSRDDPTMLVVAYSCEHNHLWPVRKNNHRPQNNKDFSPSNMHSSPDSHLELELRQEEKPLELFGSGSGSGSGSPELDATDGFGWLMGMRNTRSTILESPIYSKGYYEDHRSTTKNNGNSSNGETDMAMFFPMREEDESMFSDLGELPECTVVLRHGNNEGFTQLC